MQDIYPGPTLFCFASLGRFVIMNPTSQRDFFCLLTGESKIEYQLSWRKEQKRCICNSVIPDTTAFIYNTEITLSVVPTAVVWT